jgi:hypothetical protein
MVDTATIEKNFKLIHCCPAICAEPSDNLLLNI